MTIVVVIVYPTIAPTQLLTTMTTTTEVTAPFLTLATSRSIVN